MARYCLKYVSLKWLKLQHIFQRIKFMSIFKSSLLGKKVLQHFANSVFAQRHIISLLKTEGKKLKLGSKLIVRHKIPLLDPKTILFFLFQFRFSGQACWFNRKRSTFSLFDLFWPKQIKYDVKMNTCEDWPLKSFCVKRNK